MYKKILSGYVNKRKNGEGFYLTITNNSDEDLVIKAGEKIYLNRTSEEVLKNNPKVPHYSYSIKVDEEKSVDVSPDDIPF